MASSTFHKTICHLLATSSCVIALQFDDAQHLFLPITPGGASTPLEEPKNRSHGLVRREAYFNGESGKSADSMMTTSNITMQQMLAHSRGCTLPPTMHFGAPTVTQQKLQDSISSTSRKTTPFLWLRYGDGEFMAISGMGIGRQCDGGDMGSQCIKDGLSDMLLGKSLDNISSTAVVHQALGGFFLCKENHQGLHENMEKWAQAHTDNKFLYINDFYFGLAKPVAAHRPVVLIGPKHLDSLHCYLQHKAYFEIPLPTTGCDDVDRLVPQIVQLSRTKYPDDTVVFIVAGSAVGKMIAYKAFQSLHDKDIFIDVGASLDGYSGRKSRDYNQDLSKTCKSDKKWMSFEACTSECGNIEADVSCQKCPGE